MSKISEEKIREAQEMRAAGASYNAISKATGIPTSSLTPYIRDIEPGTSQDGESTGKLPSSMGPSKDVPLSRESIDLANKVRETQLANEEMAAELQARTLRRKLNLLDREEALELKQREIDLRAEEARLAAGQPSGDSGGPGDEIAQQRYAAAIQELEEEKGKLANERASLQEERRKVEMDALNDRITELSNKLEGKGQVGKTQFDLVSEGMGHVSHEMSELRRGLIDLLNSPNVQQRFAPGRFPPEVRRQRGEALTAAFEGADIKVARCPHCQAELMVAEETAQKYTSLECTSCGGRFPNPYNRPTVKANSNGKPPRGKSKKDLNLLGK